MSKLAMRTQDFSQNNSIPENSASDSGDTELHEAVRKGNYEFVVDLIKQGHDLFAKNRAGLR